MSEFLWIFAVGIPVSTALCLLHAAVRRRMDLMQGGAPVLGVTVLLGIVLIALFK